LPLRRAPEMSKDPSPLLGYNNNIRHKSRVFHVQTEDSGIRHPHIITHLFMDGGRILKSVKTSYADRLGAEGMADVVRQMMKEQHKAMLMDLRDGQYDHLVEAGAMPGTKKDASIKGSMGTAMTERAMATPPTSAKLPPEVTDTRQARPARGRSAPPPPVAPAAVSGTPDLDPITARDPNPPEELTLDIEALERAAAESSSPLFQLADDDLPPPPANVLRERGRGGGYRAVTPPPMEKVHPTSRPPQPGARPGPATRSRRVSSRPPRITAGKSRSALPPSRSTHPDGRYASSRPPFKAAQQRNNSIFGEDLISDKSLDEVILSYLAEDLEAPSEKKKK
jgi:hypothetical protein